MQAIQISAYGGPEVMTLTDLPDPKPGPGQVLVRLHAAGVNPVDTYLREGKNGYKPDLPFVPGIDGAGEVLALGEGVTRHKIGDRVYLLGTAERKNGGTYATQAVVQETMAFPLPDGMSFEQGAAVPVAYGTAFRALHDIANVQRGETVLIHGASGGVGIAAVQLAVAHGCLVLGTAGTDEGLQLIRDQGAEPFNHRLANYFDQLKPRKINAIIEMLANVNLEHDLKLLEPRGRVAIVGSRGRIEIDPRQFMGGQLTVGGMNLWSGGESALEIAYQSISAGLHEGVLNPIVGTVLPLKDAAASHREVMSEGKKGKIVLDCTAGA